MNLNRCRPLGDLANTGYCLADPGKEYLVFQPSTGQPVTLKLQAGKYNVEWFAPGKGQAVAKDTMEVSGGEKTLPCPVDGAAALYLRSTELD